MYRHVQTWLTVLFAVAIVLTQVPTHAAARDANPAGHETPVRDGPETETLAEPILDLAAMAIRPHDLIGAGWVQDVGRLLSVVEQAGSLRTAPVGVEDERIGRAYVNALSLPSLTNWLRPRESIETVVWELGDTETAAAAFADFAAELSEDGYVEMVDLPAIGDQSIAFRGMCDCGDEGLVPDLVLLYRIDHLVTHIDLLDYAADEPFFAGVYSLDTSSIESIGVTVADRIKTVLSGERAPGLGTAIVRIDGESRRMRLNSDDYIRLDGVDLPQYLSDRASSTGIFSGFDDATEVYWYAPYTDDKALRIQTYLYRFPNADVADDWVRNAATRLDFARHPEALVTAPDYGDASATYRFNWGNEDWKYLRTYIRVGAVVAAIDVGAQTAPSLKTAGVLAQAQTACLRAGQCATVVPLSAVFVGK